MSTRLDQIHAAVRTLAEALPTSKSSPSELAAFIKRAKSAARLPLEKDEAKREKGREAARRRALAPVAQKHKVEMTSPAGKKSVEAIIKKIKQAKHQRGLRPRSTAPKTKPKAFVTRKTFSPTVQRRLRAGHGGGNVGKSAGKQQPRPVGMPGAVYDPDIEESIMSYVPRTLAASGVFLEDVLLERKGKRARARASKLAATFPESGGDTNAPAPPSRAPSPSRGQSKKKKKKKGDGSKKNETSWKKCPRGALISSPGLRHSMPLNTFVNPDPDYPTFPVRSNCRASMAGVARSLQFARPNQSVIDQVLKRVNKGEIRGSRRLKLWGTRVGGQRMETHRGPSGKPKRHPDYGTSTGERDERLHTAKAEHGKAGNREVARAAGHASRSVAKKKTSKGKQKKTAASRKGTIARGKRTIGRRVPGHAGSPLQPEGRGSAEAEKFLKRSRADKKQKSTHKKSGARKGREARFQRRAMIDYE